jgi:hypothetical protein
MLLLLLLLLLPCRRLNMSRDQELGGFLGAW